AKIDGSARDATDLAAPGPGHNEVTRLVKGHTPRSLLTACEMVYRHGIAGHLTERVVPLCEQIPGIRACRFAVDSDFEPGRVRRLHAVIGLSLLEDIGDRTTHDGVGP